MEREREKAIGSELTHPIGRPNELLFATFCACICRCDDQTTHFVRESFTHYDIKLKFCKGNTLLTKTFKTSTNRSNLVQNFTHLGALALVEDTSDVSVDDAIRSELIASVTPGSPISSELGVSRAAPATADASSVVLEPPSWSLPALIDDEVLDEAPESSVDALEPSVEPSEVGSSLVNPLEPLDASVVVVVELDAVSDSSVVAGVVVVEEPPASVVLESPEPSVVVPSVSPPAEPVVESVSEPVVVGAAVVVVVVVLGFRVVLVVVL